jgi:catechol 2,3-dioxygenase-like lactoylglutathione lyase family enzyme
MLAFAPIVRRPDEVDRKEGHGMEKFIADLVKNFESGKVDRREFCQTVALAATVYAAGDAANAQTGTGFKTLGINHLSYACPDYTKARDFYTSVFGLESAPGKDNGKRANLMFGPEPGKGGSFIVARTATTPANPRPPSQAVVDHICFTMSNWNEQAVRGAIKAKGLEISGGRDGSLHVLDPFNYDVQFANIVEEDPFKHGGNN